MSEAIKPVGTTPVPAQVQPTKKEEGGTPVPQPATNPVGTTTAITGETGEKTGEIPPTTSQPTVKSNDAPKGGESSGSVGTGTPTEEQGKKLYMLA
ncbi:MAG: hypothetical protein PHC64_09080 [Candidatus Gastranaerophilales bacterium]|nr:hypothetical protein [Candidatus Gastranaerophilales bacterium]